jgi:hypothetical protein
MEGRTMSTNQPFWQKVIRMRLDAKLPGGSQLVVEELDKVGLTEDELFDLYELASRDAARTIRSAREEAEKLAAKLGRNTAESAPFPEPAGKLRLPRLDHEAHPICGSFELRMPVDHMSSMHRRGEPGTLRKRVRLLNATGYPMTGIYMNAGANRGLIAEVFLGAAGSGLVDFNGGTKFLALPAPLDANDEVWLEIVVAAPSISAAPELSGSGGALFEFTPGVVIGGRQRAAVLALGDVKPGNRLMMRSVVTPCETFVLLLTGTQGIGALKLRTSSELLIERVALMNGGSEPLVNGQILEEGHVAHLPATTADGRLALLCTVAGGHEPGGQLELGELTD